LNLRISLPIDRNDALKKGLLKNLPKISEIPEDAP